MPINDLGLRPIGQTRGNASLSFSVTYAAADGSIEALTPPGLAIGEVFNGVRFDYNPTAYQKQFDFSRVKRLSISVSRPKSFFVSAAVNYTAGRVIVYIPSSGQVFYFAPSQIPGWSAVYSGQRPYESETLVVDVATSSPSDIVIYMEGDTANGVTPSNPDKTTISVTAFNFDIPEQG